MLPKEKAERIFQKIIQEYDEGEQKHILYKDLIKKLDLDIRNSLSDQIELLLDRKLTPMEGDKVEVLGIVKHHGKVRKTLKDKLDFRLMLAWLVIIAILFWTKGLYEAATAPPTAMSTPPVGVPVDKTVSYAPIAVTTADIPCYSGNNEYTITISPYVVVEILEQNSTGNWVKVRVNDVMDCWVDLNSLKLNDQELASVITVDVPTPQIPNPTIAPVPTPTLGNIISTPAPPLLIRWIISSYDCANGLATGATIDLDVSGGVPEYSFSPRLPIYAKPGQFISIMIKSGTIHSEPSAEIAFTVPRATDKTEFNCEQPDNGNVPLPPPPPTEDPPPPDDDPPLGDNDPQPTEEPVCYNPQGKVIPCYEK